MYIYLPIKESRIYFTVVSAALVVHNHAYRFQLSSIVSGRLKHCAYFLLPSWHCFHEVWRHAVRSVTAALIILRRKRTDQLPKLSYLSSSTEYQLSRVAGRKTNGPECARIRWWNVNSLIGFDVFCARVDGPVAIGCWLNGKTWNNIVSCNIHFSMSVAIGHESSGDRPISSITCLSCDAAAAARQRGLDSAPAHRRASFESLFINLANGRLQELLISVTWRAPVDDNIAYMKVQLCGLYTQTQRHTPERPLVTVQRM